MLEILEGGTKIITKHLSSMIQRPYKNTPGTHIGVHLEITNITRRKQYYIKTISKALVIQLLRLYTYFILFIFSLLICMNISSEV